MKRAGVALGVVVATVCLLVIAISALAADRLVHPGRKPIERTPADVGLEFETVSFVAADGVRLEGWWIPAEQPSATVLLLHGYQQNRAELLDHAPYLHEAGFDALLFDWRAHGRSGGTFCSLGFHERLDLAAALTFTETRTGRPSVGLGYSMGAAIGILGGAEDPRLTALVADSSFATVEGSLDTAFPILSQPKLPAFPFAPIALRIAELQAGLRSSDVRPVDVVGRWAPRPILFISGARDNLVPPSESDRLVAAAGATGQLFRLAQAGHPSSGTETYVIDPDGYRAAVLSFFDAALAAP